MTLNSKSWQEALVKVIRGKIWAYTNEGDKPHRLTQSKIRDGDTNVRKIKTFQELISKTARLSFLNRRWFLFFRGQAQHFQKKKKSVSLYPSIFRDERDARPGIKIREKRFKKLRKKTNKLVEGYPQHTKEYAKELKRIERHKELAWAILQHYEIIATPYLDLTSSLRVAASFATLDSKSGYVYVIALPYPNGSITYAVDEDIKIVRLQAACPPSAKRPHFQEGYLAGSCHINPEDSRRKHNFSRRLITKFYIPNIEKFWSKGNFEPIPKKALYPEPDNEFGWI